MSLLSGELTVHLQSYDDKPVVFDDDDMPIVRYHSLLYMPMQKSKEVNIKNVKRCRDGMPKSVQTR